MSKREKIHEKWSYKTVEVRVRIMVFKTTFNNISVILWR
jgi:hypothetical protein